MTTMRHALSPDRRRSQRLDGIASQRLGEPPERVAGSPLVGQNIEPSNKGMKLTSAQARSATARTALAAYPRCWADEWLGDGLC